MILTPQNKWIHFGSKDMSDFTKHKDNQRKKNYIARHSAILLKDGSKTIDNINSPAFWSLNLLWNKPTIKGSIKDLKKKGIDIVYST